MSKDRLLSDEELRDALYDLSIQNLQDDETGEGFYAMSPKAVIDLINTQKRLYAESVIGKAPKPFINGKHPERGDTVQIDLDNNYQESLKFIQDNGAYTLWAEQRARIK